MKNVYDGVVTLDAQGEATVELPEFFDSLNGDFRYLVTPIGAPEPNLYIAEEVLNNRFKIGGGAAGTKISWQVTGIRKDQWAQAYRNPVEREKPPEERGLYLHPELYGAGEERAIGRRQHRRRWTQEHTQQMNELKRWLEADGKEGQSFMQRMLEQK